MGLVAVAIVVFLGGVSASSLAAPVGPLRPLDSSPLFALQGSAESSVVWAEYERFLLSRDRLTPLVLYFAPGCNEEEDDEAQQVPEEQEGKEECLVHKRLVQTAVELVAETLAAVQYPVVYVKPNDLPKMQHYHLVSSTPSLLWLPGRSSGRFQRYPHAETNFLDLTANSSLFTSKLGQVKDEHSVPKEAAADEINAFVRQCQERSGYFTRNARGRLSVTVPTSRNSDDDAYSWLELLPLLGLLAFIGVVINENREFVLNVVRMRFFWYVLCLGVVYIALSGLFHSIIHRRAWYYFGRRHGFVFVYPSSRRQFVLEGLVNGTWSFWLSLAAMSISDVAPALHSRLARDEVFCWSMVLVAISYMALYFTFLMKYRWLA